MARKLSYRISRWKYGLGYTLVFTLLALYIWLYDTGNNAWSYVFLISGGILFIVLEILIRSVVLTLDRDYVRIRKGIFNIRVVRAHYEDITDIGIDQNILQRIMNYGEIGINTSGTEAVELVMRGVMRPFKIEHVIRTQMERHRQRRQHLKTPHQHK